MVIPWIPWLPLRNAECLSHAFARLPVKNTKLWIEELNQRQEGIPKAANEQIQI